jgi:hypothetical protein
MLDGKLHGRHASHAQQNSQENCSSKGIKNRQKGIYLKCAGIKQQEAVRQKKKKPGGPKRKNSPGHGPQISSPQIF